MTGLGFRHRDPPERSDHVTLPRHCPWRARRLLGALVVGLALTVFADARAFVAHASATWASVALSFDHPPQIGSPSTLTVTVTPEVDLPSAKVEVVLPAAYAVSTASPAGYAIASDNTVSWSGLALSASTPYAFTITFTLSLQDTGWIDAALFDTSGGGSTQLATGSTMVRVTTSGTTVSATGAGIMTDKGPENHYLSLYDQPLMTQLTWDHLPSPGGTATATMVVSNTVSSPVGYSGVFNLPAGWSVVAGNATWNEVLNMGAAAPHSVTVQASSAMGPWQFSGELSLLTSPGPGYLVTEIGRFDSHGVWSERQIRSRPPAGPGPHPFVLPGLLPLKNGSLAPTPARAGAISQTIVPSQAACTGNVHVSGDVAILPRHGSLRDASFLGYSYFVQKWTQVGTSLVYAGTENVIGQLSQNGHYQICFDLDGVAYVWFFIYTTDGAGGRVDMPWASRVYANFGNNRVTPIGFGSGVRSVHSGIPSSWCSAGGNCTFNLLINDFHVDSTTPLSLQPSPYFRLAAIYAYQTRDFMMRAEGAHVGETRSAGEPTDDEGGWWRAAAVGNDNSMCTGHPACAGNDPYINIGVGETRGSETGIFITANHEYGHQTQHWLWHAANPMGVGGDWTEGWADGFLAAISDLDLGTGYANYNGNKPIECLPDTPLFADVLHTAATFMDFWDGVASETCGGVTYSDPLGLEWDDAWDVTMTGVGLVSACDFRQHWITDHPGPNDPGVNIMDHNLMCVPAP